ncbi:hypothetical protein [Aurantibacter sp.]|uniref:hypothetical protein n=1 Tax=Aurantibacter sp. TaxID=2807103 RepID=UPI0035C7E377
MNKKLFLALIILTSSLSISQVGIGTTTPNGALDVTSSTQGFVFPRIALANINTETVVNPQGTPIPAGTVVYNTVISGTAPNNVAPGLYFWNGSRWIAFAGSPGGLDWALKGNSGTNNGTDFLGTTDNEPLILKANSIERIRMGTSETVINEDAVNYDFRVEGTGESEMFFVDASTNHVHIRAASPFPTIDMFTSVGVSGDFPINGYASGQDTAGIYGRSETIATGTNMNSGGAFDATGDGFSTEPGWNVGIVATGRQAGVYATSTYPTNANNTTDRQGGFFSNSRTSGGGSITTQATASLAGYGAGEYYGGYFDGGQTGDDWSYVGMNFSGTDYKIIGAGTVSTIVTDTNNNKRVMFAPEAPEVLFQDYGQGILQNGEAFITLDPTITNNITVNSKHPLRVFIQLEGDCKGVFVTEKTDSGFKVKELQNGTSNTPFTWSITANRADKKDLTGTVTSKFEDVRLPLAPKKIGVHNKKMTFSKSSKK